MSQLFVKICVILLVSLIFVGSVHQNKVNFFLDQLFQLNILRLLGSEVLDLHINKIDLNIYISLIINLGQLRFMKQSGCGKIVSQRKPQNSLIKDYDTEKAINYPRISELRNKYTKEQPRTPMVKLTENLPVQSSFISNFTNKMKEKYTSNQPTKDKQRKNQQNSSYVSQFRKKAQQTNQNIHQKLNNIQEQLNQWKIREMRLFRENKGFEISKTAQQKEKENMQVRKKTQIKNEQDSRVHLPESLKISKIEEVQKIQRALLEQRINEKLFKKKQMIDESTCKLLGEFKKQRQISHQFTIFINRIKDQISLDLDFTQILLSLSNKDRLTVKDYIKKYHPSDDIQCFNISPIQQDPLQTEPKVSFKGNIRSIGEKLHQFYLKIEDHYRTKLSHNFESNTIQILFEEIGQKEVTLGHLISYVNMRTGKEFRNRALVKLLRRLQICNQIIDIKSFKKGFMKK